MKRGEILLLIEAQSESQETNQNRWYHLQLNAAFGQLDMEKTNRESSWRSYEYFFGGATMLFIAEQLIEFWNAAV